MTTQELIDYYSALLILQYENKPKAKAEIETLIRPVIMDQLPIAVQNAFNISDAVGVQLDVIGKYVGVTRNGSGFNGQEIILNDIDFRTLIKMAAVKNFSGSSLSVIQNLLVTFFPGEAFVFDYLQMRISYFISSAVGSQNLIQLFITEGLLPKPMGVILSPTVVAPIVTIFFGFRTYDAPAVNAEPFNNYDNYNMGWPWLSYSDAITV